MRSSTGQYYPALDHLRAMAALWVVTWHFLHGPSGYPVPFAGAPLFFPLALLDEGHSGVALFMTLSGYLFAKIVDGKRLNYAAFLWNRALRLLPLLCLVLAWIGWQQALAGQDLKAYGLGLLKGLYNAQLPNGGWSITVELHFYLILPLVLGLINRSSGYAALLLLASLAFRTIWHAYHGEVQTLAYWTLVGRFDQFVLGAWAWSLSPWIRTQSRLLLAVGCAFLVFYALWDQAGGFMLMPSYPSPSRWWIVLPTIEGLVYGLMIAWYDGVCGPGHGWMSRGWATLGEISYSIYLLHFFVVFDAARYVHEHIMPIDNVYWGCLWAGIFFMLFAPVAWLSYRVIEVPFLRFRKPYLLGQAG